MVKSSLSIFLLYVLIDVLNVSAKRFRKKKCDPCADIGSDIFESIVSTGICGEYQVAIPLYALKCYEVTVFDGLIYHEIQASDLNQGIFTFSYQENGIKSVAVYLSSEKGGVCFSRGKSIKVNCFKDCDGKFCETAGEELFSSLTTTNNCGEYQFHIPREIFKCFEIVFYDGLSLSNIIQNDIVDDMFTFAYDENNDYVLSITLINLETGKSCFSSRKVLSVNCKRDCKEKCKATGWNMLESITNTEECGEYQIQIEEELLKCFQVIFYYNDIVDEISADDLQNDYYTFYFDVDNYYTLTLQLIDLETGIICFEEKDSVIVACHDTCNSLCSSAGDAIMSSLIGTGVCGEYELTIPMDIFKCYAVYYHDSEATTQIFQGNLVDGAFTLFFNENDEYNIGITLVDLETGMKCYIERKTIKVDCHTTLPCSKPCETTATEIMSSLSSTDPCGEYQITIPYELFKCFKFMFYNGITVVEIDVSDVVDEFYTFSFVENNIYDLTISLTDLSTGERCLSKKFSLIVDCFGDKPCSRKCPAIGSQIMNSITNTGECGEFQLTIPEDSFNCFEINFMSSISDSSGIIEPNDVTNDGVFFFSYDDDGEYIIFLKLTDLSTGYTCFVERRMLKVDCDDTPCKSCAKLGSYILGSIVDTENCGEFQFIVPEGTTNCFQVQLMTGVQNILVQNDGLQTFSYLQNGGYMAALVLTDLETGKVCYVVKNFLLKVDCFQDSDCPKSCSDIPPEAYYSWGFHNSGTCGEYETLIDLEHFDFDCFELRYYTTGPGGTLSGLVEENDLTNGALTFNYDNGYNTMLHSFYLLGMLCYTDMQYWNVDCDNGCKSCEEYGEEIQSTATILDNCQFQVLIDEQALNCFRIDIHTTFLDFVTVTHEDLQNGLYTFTPLSPAGAYGIRMYDLDTNEVCFRKKTSPPLGSCN